MNSRHLDTHKADASFNGTHKLTSQIVIPEDGDELKEDDNINVSASPLLFLSENSKFDGDQSLSDAGPSTRLSPEPGGPMPGSVRVKKTRGKQKINIEFIQEKNKRYTTFSKRKTGLMKKAHELSSLTGAEVLLLVASETNHVYTFATAKLRNMIQSDKGKELIRTCLACDEQPSSSSSSSSSRVTSQPAVSVTPQLLPAAIHQHQPQPQAQQGLTQVSQAAMLPTSSLSHILLPQSHDNLSMAASYGGGPSGYVAEASGDNAQTIYVQIPISQIGPLKKEGFEMKQPSDE